MTRVTMPGRGCAQRCSARAAACRGKGDGEAAQESRLFRNELNRRPHTSVAHPALVSSRGRGRVSNQLLYSRLQGLLLRVTDDLARRSPRAEDAEPVKGDGESEQESR